MSPAGLACIQQDIIRFINRNVHPISCSGQPLKRTLDLPLTTRHGSEAGSTGGQPDSLVFNKIEGGKETGRTQFCF
jgi:hypothetical protein